MGDKHKTIFITFLMYSANNFWGGTPSGRNGTNRFNPSVDVFYRILLTELVPVIESLVRVVIKTSPKEISLDPIPLRLVHESLNLTIPVWTARPEGSREV